MKQFANRLLRWHAKYGRHNLPWQKNSSPYRVWVSEVMLQQTQVSTVIPYFNKFMQSFPNVKRLALADSDKVLSHWSGLGYYARARNLHKAAQVLHHQHRGRFPNNVTQLTQLPGIGRSTAGAILSLGMQISAPILDGNVKRVLTRVFAIAGWPGHTPVANELWRLATEYTPKKNTATYNQAMMDLGATTCTRSKPRCTLCPFSTNCKAFATDTISAYPTRKPKAKRPTRTTNMLILRQQTTSEIFLVKRPPTGIWGGLWSFPECAPEIDWQHFCKNEFDCEVLDYESWQPLAHQFSHFELVIQPILATVAIKWTKTMESTGQVWYKYENELPGGVAAPVQELLMKATTLQERLNDEHSEMSSIRD